LPCWGNAGAECPTARSVLFVHDEIVVKVPETNADAAEAWLVKAMTDGMAPFLAPVPVVVEAQISRTWVGDGSEFEPKKSPAISIGSQYP
jgi:DNA polymerase I-like protein with 3'-5' exonuclease and polymerase domains